MQANPFAAMSDSFNVLQGAMDQRTRNQAGRAYAGGDRQGAANALARGGMIEDAAGLEMQDARRQQALSETERAAAEARMEYLGQLTGVFEQIPEAERPQAWAQMRPQLAQLFPEEVLAQIDSAPKDDRSLGAFRAALGQEAERLQLFNTREGIVGVRNGEAELIYESQADPTAPAGYRWTADNNLEAIPGGPADPRVNSSLAASRRAPPRGGGSGGTSRPSGGAPASSGRPWERFRQ